MSDIEFVKENCKEVYDYLNEKGIYELRCIGRAFKINSPTNCKKDELILKIIGVGMGLIPSQEISKRGAPFKGVDIPETELDKIRKMFNKKKEIKMNITINQKDYKHFLQCIYLGNLVINGNKDTGEELTAHNGFVEEIYKKFIENMPEQESHFEFKNFIFEDSMERKLADFCDLLHDSVEEYFKEFQKSFFNEILANKIADTKYPVLNYDENTICSNLSTKNHYYKILQTYGDEIIHIEISKGTENDKSKILIKPLDSIEKRKN